LASTTILHTPLLHSLPLTATAAPEIYTLSLHDALPIFIGRVVGQFRLCHIQQLLAAGNSHEIDHAVADEQINIRGFFPTHIVLRDRKSTRLNSSHVKISYAVFCLKKKKTSTSDIYITAN